MEAGIFKKGSEQKLRNNRIRKNAENGPSYSDKP